MPKPPEFINMVIEDIAKCETFFQTKQNAMQLFQEIYGKYSKTSVNFPNLDTNPVLMNSRFQQNKNITTDYIRAIYGFLSAYRNNNFEDFQINTENPLISISNTAKSESNVVINVTFDQVRQQVENMSALKDDDIEEILEKIKKIEEIVDSKDRKSKKWDNSKEIIKWIADKGVDVGIALLPLLLKIN